MLQTSVVEENQNTCFVEYIFPENLIFYETTWKKYRRGGQATDDDMWRMRIACWIHKATNTHSDYVILLFHYNNGCTNAPPRYVLRTLRLLLHLQRGNIEIAEYV